MSIPFIIRDDDLCFFTDPSEIESLYGDIWNEFPITFSTVPWQKGTKAGHIPVMYWHSSRIYPIDENQKLVELIKTAVDTGKADIALHGVHHNYDIVNGTFRPELVRFNGDAKEQFRAARKYLSNLFGTNVNVFVPPSNTMAPYIAKILIDDGWNLMNLPGLRSNTRSIISIKHQVARIRRLYSFIFSGGDMITPINFGNRWEIGAFTLTPNVNVDSLKKYFVRCVDEQVPFVLATHYWEHQSFVGDSNKIKQYNMLKDFLSFVRKYDVEPIRASDLVLIK